MSGSYRQMAPGYRAMMETRLQKAQDVYDAPEPTDVADLRFFSREASGKLALLTEATRKVADLNQEWIQFLQKTKDPTVREQEDQTYERCVLSDDRGFMANSLMEQADELIGKLNERLSESRASLASQLAPASQIAPASTSHVGSTPPRIHAKLPEIPIPDFRGDVLEWSEFWPIYEEIVHSRNDMSKSMKFSYLRPHLKGTAFDAIEGIPLTDDGYDTAVAYLKERFDREKERLVGLLYAKMRNIPPAGARLTERRKTFDTCEKVFRLLENAHQDLSGYHPLGLDFLAKFPKFVVRDLHKFHKVGPESQLPELRKAMKDLIIQEEITEGFFEDTSPLRVLPKAEERRVRVENQNEKVFYRTDQRINRDENKFRSYSERPSSTFVALREAPRSPPSQCYFCHGSHFNSQCERYITSKERTDRLRELERCIRCARNHNAGQAREKCTLPVRCFYCRTEDHYGPLCPIQFPNDSIQSPPRRESANASDESPKVQILPRNPVSQRPSPSRSGLTAMASSTTSSLFQTAKVKAVSVDEHGQEHSCMVRVALDTLSTSSYILTSKARELHLQSHGSNTMLIKIFGSPKATEVSTHEVQFALTKSDGSLLPIDAFAVEFLSDIDVLPRSWPEAERALLEPFKRNELADDLDEDSKTIDVLIGADYIWKIIKTGEPHIQFPNSDIILLPSVFGKLLGGTMTSLGNQNADSPVMLCAATREECPLEISPATLGGKPNPLDIDEYFKLETIGITDCPVTSDDEKAVEKFNETVYFEDGRYHVRWPWIEEKAALLHNNYETAYRRFRSLAKRLQSEPKLLSSYREVIHQQVERGIIEKVTPSEVETTNATHYLPHHPVIKESSNTTKVRIVYDASSKPTKDDVSLNECLLRGPVLLPDLVHVLLRFRVHQIVVVSDIEKAYLQVALHRADRDVTRFLWFENDDTADFSPANITTYRFCRVAFGIIASAFLLAITIIFHLRKEASTLAEQLEDDTYVDNVISGVDDRPALEYYREAKALFQKAGMNLQEFCSNDVELMRNIPEQDRVKNPDTKVLGLKWDSQGDDTLRIPKSSKFDPFKATATKRSVLQALASVFDPLGLFQPVTLPAKLLLQRLWQVGTEWDTPIADEDRNEWLKLCRAIQMVFTVRTPRFVGKMTENSSLVVFSDASAKAYGACVYLRHETRDGATTHLVFAKSRLAPIPKQKSKKVKSLRDPVTEQISLPRLELLGAVVAAGAAQFCRKAFKMPELRIHFLMDSECVLQWLRSDRALKRFVARRVETIRDVKECEFRYVKTEQNPADYLTRGKTVDELNADDVWWHGPSWLKTPCLEWPLHNIPPISDDALREISKTSTEGVIICQVAAVQNTLEEPGPLGIDPNRFSKLYRMLRVTCVTLKFLKKNVWNRISRIARNNLPHIRPVFEKMSDGNDMTADDYQATLFLWTRHVQQTAFCAEFEAIRTNGKSEMVRNLGLRIDDDGCLRSHGRYAYANLPEGARFPLLLPPKHQFTILLINDIHSANYHVGVAQTLSELRKKYWIPQGRTAVSSVLHRCIICKKQKAATPFALPPMPAYPVERVAQSTPFQFAGVDYFGPMKVRVSDHIEKMWACLFTCLSTRAVHLEAVADCTPTEFLMALIRFIARRGCPELIISDNAAQFRLTHILGNRAWRQTPDDPDILSHSAKHGIKWHFITELAPWQGGHYERLVGVIKSLLKTTIGRRLLTWTDFITMLTETESVVNNRPITYVHGDVNSMFDILRPCDFLLHKATSMPASETDFPIRDLGDSGKRLASIWKQRQRQLQKLWEWWYTHYLTSLRERTQHSHRNPRGSSFRVPREGEVVLLREDDLPRGSWKIARVLRLVKGADGVVRAAEIKIPSGYIIRRAINFLYPLEIDEPEETRPQTQGGTIRTTSADDDDDFLGFSTQDIQRTTDALRRFDPSDANDSGDDQ